MNGMQEQLAFLKQAHKDIYYSTMFNYVYLIMSSKNGCAHTQ